MKNAVISVIFLVFHLILSPQLHAHSGSDHGDFMRQNGMLYVVLGVLVILFIGLFIYLWLLDRRLSKLEQQKSSSDE